MHRFCMCKLDGGQDENTWWTILDHRLQIPVARVWGKRLSKIVLDELIKKEALI